DRLASAGVAVEGVSHELADLDQRSASGELHVALFGAVNAGKSALVRALAPDAPTVSDVIGGTTREVTQYRGRLANGLALVLADVPGTQEDPGRESIARDE